MSDIVEVIKNIHLGSNESLILRYRPLIREKAQLQTRQHDLGGTDYTHVQWLNPDELHYCVIISRMQFLYTDEGNEYLKKYPISMKEIAVLILKHKEAK